MSTLIPHIILQNLDVDEALLKNDANAYNSYTVPDDTVIQLVPPGNDDSEFYTVTYVQVVSPIDKDKKLTSGPLVCIIQLEGLPEDPINIKMDQQIEGRIYKQTF